MSKPKFSIIIPTYNRALLLQRVISDILAQDIGDWEVIVVDDGSTDETEAVIRDINKGRIKYFYQENMGECEARNTGLKHSTGEWICYVDSDDTITTNYLSTFSDLIDKEHKVYSVGVSLWWPKSNKKVNYIPSLRRKAILQEYLNGHYNLMPFCLHHSIAKSRSFEKGIIYGGDFQYLLPILLNEKIKSSQKITSSVIEHDGRIVNRIYENPEVGYKQMKHSTVNCILKNREKIVDIVGIQFYNSIVNIKNNNFLIGVADQNISGAIRLMRKEKLFSLRIFLLLILQRIKGAIKSLVR